MNLDPVNAAEIRWSVPPITTPDVLTVSDEDMAVSALQESESFRLLAYVALGQIADLRRELARQRAVAGAMRDELRRYTRRQVEAAC